MGDTYIIDGKRVSRDGYNKHKYDRFLLTVKQGQQEKIEEYAEILGKSRNSYIVGLIEEDMKKAGYSLE